jgi:hypothetical protein
MVVTLFTIGPSGCSKRQDTTQASGTGGSAPPIQVAFDRFTNSWKLPQADVLIHDAVFQMSNTSTERYLYPMQAGAPLTVVDRWQNGKWRSFSRPECAFSSGLGQLGQLGQLGPHESVSFKVALLTTKIPQRVGVITFPSSKWGPGPVWSARVLVPE